MYELQHSTTQEATAGTAAGNTPHGPIRPHLSALHGPSVHGRDNPCRCGVISLHGTLIRVAPRWRQERKHAALVVPDCQQSWPWCQPWCLGLGACCFTPPSRHVLECVVCGAGPADRCSPGPSRLHDRKGPPWLARLGCCCIAAAAPGYRTLRQKCRHRSLLNSIPAVAVLALSTHLHTGANFSLQCTTVTGCY